MIDPGNPAALAAFCAGDMANARAASQPGGIEAQERAGQAALVASSAMPLTLYPDQGGFERAGFTFGKRATAPLQDVLQEATGPAGWTRKAREHALGSDILDARGRVRVEVFFKAAFYDRKAHARLLTRFTPRILYDQKGDTTAVVDNADGKTVRQWPSAVFGEDETARSWLDEYLPRWKDPLAYWDEELPPLPPLEPAEPQQEGPAA